MDLGLQVAVPSSVAGIGSSAAPRRKKSPGVAIDGRTIQTLIDTRQFNELTDKLCHPQHLPTSGQLVTAIAAMLKRGKASHAIHDYSGRITRIVRRGVDDGILVHQEHQSLRAELASHGIITALRDMTTHKSPDAPDNK